MYFFLILFFASLVGIVAMISMKLALIEHKEHHHEHEGGLLADIIDIEKIKHSSVKNLKKNGRILIWVILRTYILSINWIKNKSKEKFQKIKNKINKHTETEEEKTEARKPSKYLSVISEYREKIKKIKHKIKEEEGIK